MASRKSVYDDVVLSPLTPDVLLRIEEIVLPQALAGDYEAFTRVAFVCSEAIKGGYVLTPALTAFVSGGLRAMADGADPREAWHIERKRGQKNTSLAYMQATQRAFLVEMARQEGATYEEAVNLVAEREYVSTHTVERAWKAHHHKIVKRADGSMGMFTGPLEGKDQA
jgi:hypothetical protein